MTTQSQPATREIWVARNGTGKLVMITSVDNDLEKVYFERPGEDPAHAGGTLSLQQFTKLYRSLR